MTMGPNEQVKRGFVILHRPGQIPEKKGPFTSEPLLGRFTREVIACRPADTRIIVARLTWDDDLWLDDGREMIRIDDAMSGNES
jgi:hypothetical protein